MKRIVIVGGGSAGVMFTNRMRREFPEDELELTVIERSDKHYFQPAFTLMAFGLDEGEDVVKSTKDLFYEGVNLIADSATRVNPENNTITTTKHGTLSYDHLVIATGAKLNFTKPAGMKEGLNKGENVFTFYTMNGALKLRDAFGQLKGGTIVSMSSEATIKWPSGPINFILMAENRMRMLGVRDKYKFVLSTPMPSVSPEQSYQESLNSILDSKGIEVVNNFAPEEVDYEKGSVKSYGGEKVNFHLLSKQYSNIYAIGDAISGAVKTMTTARVQAKVLTCRMKALLIGKEPTAKCKPDVLFPVRARSKSVFAENNYDALKPLYWTLMLRGLL